MWKDLAEIAGGLIGLNPEIPDFHLTVHACYLQLRIEAEEGIATPGLIGLDRFQHIAVCGYVLEYPHSFDWGGEVGKNLKTGREYVVFPGFRDFLISYKDVFMFMNITS
ncbi:MAG: hypothetical protein SPK48_07200 [Bullifex sp.]|nr:hypothetical protein [Spirochaetales bacterium]MDY5777615.1 hypothetical protein [Bullifex sp.]